MKKFIPFILVGVLLCSGLGAVAAPNHDQTALIKTEILTFNEPVIQTINDASFVSISNANSYLRIVGAPLLPAQVTTYVFPFGTKVNKIDVSFSEPTRYSLEHPLVTTPSPTTIVDGTTITPSSAPVTLGARYPDQLYQYTMGAGIQNEDHVLYVNVYCYPVQYQPTKNTILYYQDAKITVSYTLPTSSPRPLADDYNLIIISPNQFVKALEPLVDHKISKGVTTKLVTVDDINNEVYFPLEGRDCAEEMKYFIKNAFDSWGTRYVLIVGGRFGGIMSEKWWLPVRYSNLDDNSDFETSYLSDLYFADIYDSGGNFSSWDPNENGVFAEWTIGQPEIIDLYPDVYVGRLACLNSVEVKLMVNKIITYESSAADPSWFNRMVVVGGDSAPGDSWYEGEEENQKALNNMSGFTGVKCWTSDGSLAGPESVISAVSEGCGFLFFDGHGNPTVWSTHPPNNGSSWITGLSVFDMKELSNKEKLPVTVIGGCHNSQFNVSIMNFFAGVLKEGMKYFQYKEQPLGKFWRKEWIPECWSWHLARKIGGGAIAVMGYTGLDWFATGDDGDGIPDCTQYFSGFANTQFFINYGENDITILGQTHTQTITDYLIKFPPFDQKLDCKTVQEWALLGDPSLQIGGYA